MWIMHLYKCTILSSLNHKVNYFLRAVITEVLDPYLKSIGQSSMNMNFHKFPCHLFSLRNRDLKRLAARQICIFFRLEPFKYESFWYDSFWCERFVWVWQEWENAMWPWQWELCVLAPFRPIDIWRSQTDAPVSSFSNSFPISHSSWPILPWA